MRTDLDAVSKLAEQLLVGEINERRVSFQRAMATRVAELAGRGINRSGAAYASIAELCNDEILLRADLARDAFETAAEASDIRFRLGLPDAMALAYDKLFEDKWTDVQSTFDKQARSIGINVPIVLPRFRMEFRQTAMAATTKAHGLLGVFAARQRTRMKVKRREAMTRLAYLVGGAMLAKVPDLYSWFARLVHINN
jgi:hypothetical protein